VRTGMKRRTFRIEPGVRYLSSQRQASLVQWKAKGYRENAPLLRERFDALDCRATWAGIFPPIGAFEAAFGRFSFFSQ